jgi:hypothetical protein
MNLLLKFARLPWGGKRLIVEAAWGLTRAKCLLAFVPVRRLLGKPLGGNVVPVADPPPPVLAEIRWAVNAVSKAVPFSNICLVQALTARRMARRRGIATVLCLGVGRDDRGRLIFHAWLKFGDFTITGGRTEGVYRTLDAFA